MMRHISISLITLLLIFLAITASAQGPLPIMCPVENYYFPVSPFYDWQVVFKNPGWSGYPAKQDSMTAVFDFTGANAKTDFEAGITTTRPGIRPYVNQEGYPLKRRFAPMYFPKGIDGKTASMTQSPLIVLENERNYVHGSVFTGLNLLGYGIYEQIDPQWADEFYAKTQTLFRYNACALTAGCNALVFCGCDDFTPWTLNAEMLKVNGYEGGANVKFPSIALIARAAGHNIHYVRNLPGGVDTSIARKCGTICTVKNRGHYVNTVEKRSDGQHVVIDPAGKTNVLEWYSGVETDNVRSFYLGQGKVKTAYTGQIDWSDSAILIYSPLETVTLNLLKGLELLMGGETQKIENPFTGEITTHGVGIDYTGRNDENGIPYGRYRLQAHGPAGTSVVIHQYARDETPKDTTLEIGSSGELTYDFIQEITGYVPDVGGIKDVELGTTLEIGSGYVTAVVPGGFYLQAQFDRTPAIYVQWNSQVSAGHPVKRFIGQVQEANGVRFFKATAVELEPTVERAKPVGTAPEKVSTTFHLYTRIFGKITSPNVLNDSLTLANPVTQPVGSFVTLQGVYHEGVFYHDLAF